jgi:hypothetical protein
MAVGLPTAPLSWLSAVAATCREATVSPTTDKQLLKTLSVRELNCLGPGGSRDQTKSPPIISAKWEYLRTGLETFGDSTSRLRESEGMRNPYGYWAQLPASSPGEYATLGKLAGERDSNSQYELTSCIPGLGQGENQQLFGQN